MNWVKQFYDAANQPEWQKLHVGWDFGGPEGDQTIICLRSRNAGKSALAKESIRKAKRKGYRVIEMNSK